MRRMLWTALAVSLLLVSFALTLQTDSSVRGAHSGMIDYPTLELTIPDFLDQSAFGLVASEAAFGFATGQLQTIAIFDTGFDSQHKDIDWLRVAYQWDFVQGDADVSEQRDGIDQDNADGPDSMFHHGTASLSLLMELAPEASFLLYRVLDEEGVGDPADLEAAIDDAVGRGATVLNLSLTLTPDFGVRGAINDAHNAGVTVVAASGNDSSLICSWPASLGNVIAVGSVDNYDDLVPLANNGQLVDILAPGLDVVVALAETVDEHGYGTGTSYSTPFVAAAVALIREATPGISFDDILDDMRDNAVDIGLTAAQVAAGKCGLRLDMEAALATP